jgi:glyceraldehyde 3-phosphate dehydrogenase
MLSPGAKVTHYNFIIIKGSATTVQTITIPGRLQTASLGNSSVMAMGLPRASSQHLSSSATKTVVKIMPELNRKFTGMAFCFYPQCVPYR